MTTTPPSHGPPSSAQDVAKIGPFRPPLVYLVSILAGALIHRAAALPFVPGTLAVPLGASLIVVAIALFASAIARFRAAGTPVPARKPTTAMVRTGPYRFSRNPIYLAFSVFQLGLAIWINSLWILVTLVGAVGLTHFVVIPREEQYLERRFGTHYSEYKSSVRPWL